MARRKASSGSAAAFAALALAAAPPGAAAAGDPFPGFDAKRPIASAAAEIMRLVREKCLDDGGATGLMVGVESMPVLNSAFTKDQGHHLSNQVYSALSQLSGHRMTPFSDIGAVAEVMSVGLGRSQGQEERRLLDQINLVVRVDGQKVNRGIRFRLSAVGRSSVNCAESTPYVDAPQDLIGDVFVSPEQIFTGLARDLWEQALPGLNQVAIESRTVVGQGLDAILPGYFERALRKALKETREDRVNLGEPRDIEVVPRREATVDPAFRWDADVVVEQTRNGFKVDVDVRKPGKTALFQSGVVAADDMPSLRSVDLTRTAAIARPQPPRTTAGARQQTPQLRQAARNAPGEVPALQLGQTPTRVVDALDDQNPEPRYGFELTRESFVELDVKRRTGPSLVIKPELVSANGMPVKPSFEGKARPNLRRYRLPAGRYEVSLTTEGQGRTEYELSTRAVDIGRMLEPEPPGRLTRRFQDWYAGETQRGGRKVCYAYTTAMEVAPVGWREQRPIIWLSMSEDQSEPLNHMLDDIQRYHANRPVKALFEAEGGAMRPLEVKALSSHIQPVALNAAGQAVLNRDAIRGYTLGSSIELAGETPEGRPATVRYSLLGYRSAVNAAALNCGRSDLARDLVWK